MNRLLVCLLLASALPLRAQTPTITISKSDTVAIAVQPLQGADAAEATRVLQNDLNVSGQFNLTDAAKAGFIVSGISSGGSLQGKVLDPAGRTVLQGTYEGSTRSKAHKFADDIIETITGKPGFANTKIAFVATRTGRKEIYTADADGSNVQQLTRDNSISVAPTLSADGTKLAYTGYQSGYADVYLIQLGSGARQRIVKFPGTNSGAAFSPDGGRIALSVSKDGNPELYVTNASGGGASRLTRSRGVESSPCWSPDGSEIIYSSDETGSPQLRRISSGGGASRALSTGYTYCTEPDWSPDGKKIAFNVRQSGEFAVAVLDLETNATRIVATGQNPVWARNSRHLLYADGGLYLLDVQNGRKTKLVDGLGKISEPTWSR